MTGPGYTEAGATLIFDTEDTSAIDIPAARERSQLILRLFILRRSTFRQNETLELSDLFMKIININNHTRISRSGGWNDLWLKAI